jgi:ribosomal protein S21
MTKEGRESKLFWRIDMVEVRLDGDGLERAIVQLRKKLLHDGVFREIKTREIPCKGERCKAKRARALRRLLKHEGRRARYRGEATNNKTPCWKFIRRDGECFKVMVRKDETYQHG